MDVDNHNFSDALAIFESLLPHADFVAFDLEFSGLGDKRPTQLDTPQERYETARQDASIFRPLQFGLVLFHRRPREQVNGDTETSHKETNAKDTHEWLATPFNFNLFPRAVYYPSNSRYPIFDRIIHFQSSAVHFLNIHQFNFTKCFAAGVSWLRSDHEDNVLKHIETDLTAKHSRICNTKDQSAEEKVATAKHINAIKTWVDCLRKEKDNKVDTQVSTEQSKPDSNHKQNQSHVKMFELPHSSKERKFVFDGVKVQFPNVVCRSLKTQEGVRLRAEYFQSVEHAKASKKEVIRMSAEDHVYREVQFRYVIDALRKHNTKLVAHNCLLDLTKTFESFVDDLPETLEDFKQKVSKSFGPMADSRWIYDYVRGRKKEMQKENVEHGIEAMEKLTRKHCKGFKFGLHIPTDRKGRGFVVSQDDDGNVKEKIEDWEEKDVFGFGRYACKGFVHEAGYDAWITGRLYTALGFLEGGIDKLKTEDGKIYLGSCGGYKFIDIDGIEKNEWYGRNGVIIEGKKKGRGNEWQKAILELLLIDTKVKVDDVDRATISGDRFVGLLKSEKEMNNGNEVDEQVWTKVQENGKKYGIKVERYWQVLKEEKELWQQQIKRRRLA